MTSPSEAPPIIWVDIRAMDGAQLAKIKVILDPHREETAYIAEIGVNSEDDIALITVPISQIDLPGSIGVLGFLDVLTSLMSVSQIRMGVPWNDLVVRSMMEQSNGQAPVQPDLARQIRGAVSEVQDGVSRLHRD